MEWLCLLRRQAAPRFFPIPMRIWTRYSARSPPSCKRSTCSATTHRTSERTAPSGGSPCAFRSGQTCVSVRGKVTTRLRPSESRKDKSVEDQIEEARRSQGEHEGLFNSHSKQLKK